MIVFGVDVPLIGIILALAVISFIILFETIIIVALLISQVNKTKKLSETVESLTEKVLAIKKAEIEELGKLKLKK